MKLVLAAAAAFACMIPAAASAQSAPATAPAPAPAPAAAAKFNLDTPIEVLVADEKAKAVVAAGLGGDPSQHPSYDMFKGMSLRQVQPMSGGAVTEEMLATIEKGLAEIK
jgi:hypothetical protein